MEEFYYPTTTMGEFQFDRIEIINRVTFV